MFGMRRVPRITSEDLTGCDFTGSPAEIPIITYMGREIADLAPDCFHQETLNDIARAIIDHGWRSGVRACEIQVRRDYRTIAGRRVGRTRMVGRLTYA
jgi:hypothetical protein